MANDVENDTNGMSFWKWLAKKFGRGSSHVSVEEEVPDLEVSDRFLQRRADGTEVIDVQIYTSERLLDANGRAPEQMLAIYLEDAFKASSYGFNIRYNLDPIDVESEKARCSPDGTFPEWRQIVNEGIDPAKDVNVLLTNVTTGGCGLVGGNVCCAGGAGIEEMRAWEQSGSEPFHMSISAAMHEIGHNLSLPHDTDSETEGKQHTGFGWNDHSDKTWHRTPMNVGNNVTNACGEYVEKRQYNKTVQELYYHDCSFENFEVAPPDEDENHLKIEIDATK